ncbi:MULTISPECIES: hypothetical protein [Streptomyces]|uniref:hypothetical protein n=1 Tax=Streptomyces TaxID=1883 RepID=UPI001E2A631F|nr:MULTISPECIES: hypothetical protein [Streptomyces]UFQ16437.1 hypothetical protein J2N69_16290 [Streptomyces huasconensis]WCL86039.1 hypothetical protein PPN52_16300 [Streptomyces sp. JCM 35825]
MNDTYTYHWAVVEWTDSDRQQRIHVTRTTKGRDAAVGAGWTWAHRNLAPATLNQTNVRYLGRSETYTKY